MVKWTQKAVEKRLKQTKGYDSFISLSKGYLPIKINGISIIIFREDVGVSYYYCFPILDFEKAKSVNDFMLLAKPFLKDTLTRMDTNCHLHNPAPKTFV